MINEKKQISFVRWIVSIFAILFWEMKKYVLGGIIGAFIPIVIVKLFTTESLYAVIPISFCTGAIGVMITMLHDDYLNDNKTL